MKKQVLVEQEALGNVLKLFGDPQSLREQIVVSNLDSKLKKADSCITQLVASVTPVGATQLQPNPDAKVEFLGFYKLPEPQEGQLYMCNDKGCDDIKPIFIEEDNHVVYDGCMEDPDTKVLHRKYSMAQVCNHCRGELSLYDETINDVVTGTYQQYAPVPAEIAEK